MEHRRKGVVIHVLMVLTLALMPLGSPGDKVVLIVLAQLVLQRTILRAIGDSIRSSALLTCVLYSSMTIAAVWANSRYRLGGGPFHLSLDADWRGYPFPYQEWGLVSNGELWRKFCWRGAFVDALFIGLGCIAVEHLLRPTFTPTPRILILSTYSAVFLWLNTESWLFAVPAFFLEGP
jgi:hypothetical protein